MSDFIRPKPQNFPVENISVGRYGNPNFKVGVASMQGFKNNMEDFYIIELNLVHHPNVGLFGIFDGHNGTNAARWFSENISNVFDSLSSFSAEEIKRAIIEIDAEYLRVTGNKFSGTTATLLLVEKTAEFPDKSHKITICHIGDSRFYIGKYTSPSFTLRTEDHKPSTEEEKKRIISAGGSVVNGRVDSLLAVSRALGDHCYKANPELPATSQKVVALPDINVSYVGNDDYLFLCCDGILDSRIVKEGDGMYIFEFINEGLTKNTDTGQILAELIKTLLENGAKDNMTAILIELKNGQDYDRGTEFIAGVYYEGGNPTYISAFKNNCEHNGKTVDEVRKIYYDQNSQRNKDETDQSKN